MSEQSIANSENSKPTVEVGFQPIPTGIQDNTQRLYRCTTLQSELLFNRSVRGTLPVLYKNLIVKAREKERKRQEYNKSYINNRRGDKKSNISVGDYVLVRQPKQNKLTPYFNQQPYRVVYRNRLRGKGSQ